VAEVTAMLTIGKALKVTVYLSDGGKHKGVPAYTSVLDFLYSCGWGLIEVQETSVPARPWA
jgi:hypothetical protein